MSDAWQEPPYGGPPPTTPPPAGTSPYGDPGYGHPGYGYPGHGYPGHPGYPGYGYPGNPGYGYPGDPGYPGYGWGPVPPVGPQRPGQVVGAAVLAFVQAAVTAVATFYVFVLASFAGVTAGQGGTGVPADVGRYATEGRVIAVVQLVGVVVLVVGGVLALVRRGKVAWVLLVAALALEVVLAVYWLVRLMTFADDVSVGGGSTGAFLVLGLFFAAMPATGLALICLGEPRRWFLQPGPRGAAGAA